MIELRKLTLSTETIAQLTSTLATPSRGTKHTSCDDGGQQNSCEAVRLDKSQSSQCGGCSCEQWCGE